MKLRKIVLWFIKAIIACIIAFTLMTGCCVLYYNIPVHFTNESGATDYKWEESKFYSRGTEGFALGKTDSNGFNNKENPDGKTINILFTGSSHGEGFNVAQDEVCTSRLNDLFKGDKFVYNIATSSHNLPYLCKDLDAALTEYKPTEYVIIECQSVELKTDAMTQAVDGTLPLLESESEGVVGLLQKVPYLRLLYLQMSNINASKKTASAEALPEMPDSEYSSALTAMIEKIKADSDKHSVTPIIIYHPHFSIDESGKVITQHNSNYVELFSSLCSKNGITFINMEDDFIREYTESYTIPYGFSNTAIGEGHLNTDGHKLLAQKLYDTIEDMEAEK